MFTREVEPRLSFDNHGVVTSATLALADLDDTDKKTIIVAAIKAPQKHLGSVTTTLDGTSDFIDVIERLKEARDSIHMIRNQIAGEILKEMQRSNAVAVTTWMYQPREIKIVSPTRGEARKILGKAALEPSSIVTIDETVTNDHSMHILPSYVFSFKGLVRKLIKPKINSILIVGIY